MFTMLTSGCDDSGKSPADDSPRDPSQKNDGGSSNIGKIAFASERGGNFELYVINADGTGLANLTNDPADDGGGGFNVSEPNFSWSPDGTRMAFISDRDGNPEIYVMNADGTEQTRLTETPDEQESQLHWSPDGTRIAFVSTVREPKYDKAVQVMRIDGTELSRVEAEDRNGSEYPAWSPDGTRIAFDASDIHVVDVDGGRPVNLTSADEIGEGNESYLASVWSPDGSRIAFDAWREADNGSLYIQIYVMSSDGSELIRVPDGANEDDYYSSPSWSPDGKRMAFYSDEGAGSNIHVMDADGSNESRITETGALIGVWSPHGDWIAALTLKRGPDGQPSGALTVMNPDGSERTELTDILSGGHIAWSPVP